MLYSKYFFYICKKKIMKKRIYSKPILNKIKLDNQISLVMMTSEGAPPNGPFGSNIKLDWNNKSQNPYKA